MLKQLCKFIYTSWFMTEREQIEHYLAQSISLADLERRQKDLQKRGLL